MDIHVTSSHCFCAFTIFWLSGPPYKEDLPLEKSDTEDMLYAEENDVYKMYLTHDAYKDRVEKNNPIKSNMGNIVPKESTNNIEDYEEDMFGQGIFDEFDFPSFNSFEINWLIISKELTDHQRRSKEQYRREQGQNIVRINYRLLLFSIMHHGTRQQK